MQPYIRIQSEDFKHEDHYSALATGDAAGAVVTFVGRARRFIQPDGAAAGMADNRTNDARNADQSLWLEHYPGMTEKVLLRIVVRAQQRWSLFGVRIVHRVGRVQAGEQIVLVGVSAAHRHEAFAACEFLIDCLKTEAPFWKREGRHWVDAKTSDHTAVQRWQVHD